MASLMASYLYIIKPIIRTRKDKKAESSVSSKDKKAESYIYYYAHGSAHAPSTLTLRCLASGAGPMLPQTRGPPWLRRQLRRLLVRAPPAGRFLHDPRGRPAGH